MQHDVQPAEDTLLCAPCGPTPCELRPASTRGQSATVIAQLYGKTAHFLVPLHEPPFEPRKFVVREAQVFAILTPSPD